MAESFTLGVHSTAAESRSAEGVGAAEFRRRLDAVWTVHASRLASLAAALGLKAEQTADVLQDVYLTTLRQPPAMEDPTDLVRWLFRVTANRANLEHRRRGSWRKLWQSLARTWQSETAACGELHIGELRADVERALATLESDDRTLVAMRYFSELNSQEIAEIVGIPEATVRGRLRVVRRKLALELADWNDE